MSESAAAVSSVAAVDLSERGIKVAQPGAVLRDAVVKGLHLRVFPGSKVFYLYFRTKGGKRRCPKVGTYGQITLTQARDAARTMLAEVAAGRDPVAEREAEKDSPTTDMLWAQYRRDRGAKKKSEAEDARMWSKYCGSLHNRKVDEIKYQDVADLFAGMADIPVQANRVLAMLSTLFNFAVAPLRWIENNPCAGIQTNKERKRRRYLTMEEAAKMAARLEAEAEANPATAAFIWLLILTGARKGEIAKAKWTDLQGNKLVLREHKTDGADEDRIIYLSPEAMHVIDQLPRTTGTIAGVQNPQALWEKIRRDAGCPDLHLHDLRHSFASLALGAGFTLPQIGELLGHRSPETTKRYAHLADESAHAAAGKIGGLTMARMTLADKT